MGELRDNSTRAKWAIATTIASMAGLFLFFAGLYFIYWSYNSADFYYDDSFGLLAIFFLTLIAELAIIVISFVLFIRWFRRAYYNLHRFVPNVRYADGWAAGSWFIPGLNFFMPYIIMRELWTKTGDYLHRRLPVQYPQRASSGLIITFWVVSLASMGIAEIASLFTEFMDEDVETLIIICFFIFAPVILVWIFELIIIIRYSKMESDVMWLTQQDEEHEGEVEVIEVIEPEE